jgi:arginine decarboxylase
MIRIVWGAGTGPTELASYDAALAAAGVHNYNLVGVSSVVPPDRAVTTPGTAPDLGPVGSKLTVVEARATGEGRVAACLGWALSEEGGLFYEAGVADDGEVRGERVAGDGDPEAAARERVLRGIEAGQQHRDWAFAEPTTRTATASSEREYATAVVLGVYGDADPV